MNRTPWMAAMLATTLFLVPVTAWSEDAPVSARAVTAAAAAGPSLPLAEAVRIALERNPRIRDAEIGAALARERIIISRSYCGTTSPPLVSAVIFGRVSSAALGCELGFGAAAAINRSVSPPFFTSTSILGGAFIGRALETGGSATFSLDTGRLHREGFTDPAGAVYVPANWNLSLNHPLLQGLELSFEPRGVKRAKIDADIASKMTAYTASEVVRDVVDAYWSYYLALEALEISRAGVTLTGRELERVKALRDIGGGAVAGGARMLITDLDVMVVERKLMEREAGVVDAEIAVETAAILLRRSMGSDHTTAAGRSLTDRPPADPGSAIPMAPDLAAEKALAWDPNAAALRANVDKEELTLKDMRNLALPILNLAASIGGTAETRAESPDPTDDRSLATRLFSELFDPDALGYSVSLTFGMPFDNKAARSRVRSSEMSIERNKELIRDYENLVAEIAINSAMRVRAAARRVELNRRALEISEASLASAEARAEVGTLSEFDKLDVIDALEQARLAVVRSEVELLRTRAALLHITGDLLGSFGITLE